MHRLFTANSESYPKIKSRIHKFTDVEPGVGVKNLDVKFRMAEIIHVTDAATTSYRLFPLRSSLEERP
jgi:hypothetical protein